MINRWVYINRRIKGVCGKTNDFIIIVDLLQGVGAQWFLTLYYINIYMEQSFKVLGMATCISLLPVELCHFCTNVRLIND